MDSLKIQIILSAVALLVFVIGLNISARVLSRISREQSYHPSRLETLLRFNRAMWLVLLVWFLSFIWGWDFYNLYLYSSGVMAIVGVAFFAHWSVLSNITAGILIYFRWPVRVGDWIRFQDEESGSARVKQMNLFNIILEDEKGGIWVMPNNLALQKVVVIETKPLEKKRTNASDSKEAS